MADRVQTYSRKPQRFAVACIVGATDLGEPILASEDRDTIRRATLFAKKHQARIFERETMFKTGPESWEAEETCVANFGFE